MGSLIKRRGNILKRFTLLLFLAAFGHICCAQSVEDSVHPLVGTEREGQTYPAAGVPYAMTNWTPQTRAGEIKCISPYYFTDDKIQGFRGSHFLSGSCVPDYGSVTLMPGAGDVHTDAVSRGSHFSRESERATPYEYRVRLTDSDIAAQITGTTRSGIMLFRFEKAAKQAWIVVENNARGGDGWVRIDAVTSNDYLGRFFRKRERDCTAVAPCVAHSKSSPSSSESHCKALD